MKIFKNKDGSLRNIWWIAIFFLVLALLTFPLVLLSQHYGWEISIGLQAVVVIATNFICQLLRKKPFTEILGPLNSTWLRQLLIGALAGALLMLIPALFLYLGGWVHWKAAAINGSALLSFTAVFIGVALAEEFLFRGFLFQRLMDGIGACGAQILIAAYFLLTHMGNPGMTGNIKLLASVNIFLASVLFGLAFIRTKSLALPIGLHFMANWVQGTLLGFGVSGTDQTGIFRPVFSEAPAWLTGSAFGLEASLPGLLTLMIMIVAFYKWQPKAKQLITHHRNV